VIAHFTSVSPRGKPVVEVYRGEPGRIPNRPDIPLVPFGDLAAGAPRPAAWCIRSTGRGPAPNLRGAIRRARWFKPAGTVWPPCPPCRQHGGLVIRKVNRFGPFGPAATAVPVRAAHRRADRAAPCDGTADCCHTDRALLGSRRRACPVPPPAVPSSVTQVITK